MDSILDLNEEDQREITTTLRQSDFYKQNAALILEDCFNIITSSGAKLENFNCLKQTDKNEEVGEIYDKMLILTSLIFKNGVKSDEFSMILEELGFRSSKAKEPMLEIFRRYEKRVESVNGMYEDEGNLKMGSFKKFPLNL